jgi:tRNA(Ile)-lysidine synthase
MRTGRREIEAAVARTAEMIALWPAGATLVAAVSGGADSLCLLGILHSLRLEQHPMAPGEIVVAHLDHGLRGSAGAADARFVAALTEDLGLPCVVERADVAALAREERRSVEDTARRARYAFLRRAAAEAGAARICTGHTLDDQAETVILHVLRGSGLGGLAGMAPLAGDLARPLLEVTREETEAYCAARGWVPRVDATNADLRYVRNRVRRELLPLLETYNPNLRTTLAHNAALIREDVAFVETQAEAAWGNVADVSGKDGITLDLAALSAQPPALRHRMYRRAAVMVAGGDAGLEARHLALIDRLRSHRLPGHAQSLPGWLRVWREDGALRFERADHRERQTQVPELPPLPLPVPGMVEMPELGWRVRAWVADGPPGLERPAYPSPPDLPPFARAGDEARVGHAVTRAYLAPDFGAAPLVVRNWRPGDRFRPMGMSQEKKLQDYFGDAKVPLALRRRLPLVFGPDHLLWIAGLRLDDRAKLGPYAPGALILQLEPLAQ